MNYTSIANRATELEALLKDAYQTVFSGIMREASDFSGMVCPLCLKGNLRQISGIYGIFYGCSGFPSCRYTRSM